LVPNPSEGRVRVIFGGEEKKRLYGLKTADNGSRGRRSRQNYENPSNANYRTDQFMGGSHSIDS